MKRILCIVSSCISLTAFSANNYNSHNINTIDNQEAMMRTIERSLRQPGYATDILPNDFSNVTRLLEYSPNISFSRSVFKVFGNLLKASPYVNSYAFNEFLSNFPPLIHKYCIPYRTLNILGNQNNVLLMNPLKRLEESFSVMLYDNFIDSYAAFKQDPDQYLKELAFEVFDLAKEEVSVQNLRSSVIRFLELAINKLIWNPKDPMRAWDSAKEIAAQLTLLLEYNVLEDVDDLDDLFWSLVHRFCFYVDLAGSDIPLAFYEQIKQDISSHEIVFLDLDEQTTFLETKRSLLTRTILTAEAQAKITLLQQKV